MIGDVTLVFSVSRVLLGFTTEARREAKSIIVGEVDTVDGSERFGLQGDLPLSIRADAERD